MKKAGDLTGVRSDFELLVRIADRMGADIHKLVPFGKPLRSDTGQSRGAQTGEVDRHAVWLHDKNLEPKLSPFDSMAMLDEIQRLVPGYADISRLKLLSGGYTHTESVGEGVGSAAAFRGSDRARERHPIHLGHAGTLLAHPQLRHREPPPHPASRPR